MGFPFYSLTFDTYYIHVSSTLCYEIKTTVYFCFHKMYILFGKVLIYKSHLELSSRLLEETHSSQLLLIAVGPSVPIRYISGPSHSQTLYHNVIGHGTTGRRLHVARTYSKWMTYHIYTHTRPHTRPHTHRHIMYNLDVTKGNTRL